MPRLLLADDSVAIQRLVELTFSHEHIDVTTVGDGEAAIASITADPPDIVLADIGMPKRSGYDVAAFVKEQFPFAKIPVLLLAGAFEPVDEARAAQVRCDGVLVKPFEPPQVIARVRELLGIAPGVPTPATGAEPHPVERLASLKLVGAPAPQAEESLDNYFDRLDAAFASLDGRDAPPASRPLEESTEPAPRPDEREFEMHPTIDESLNKPLEEDEGEVPTVDRILGLQPPREPHRPAPDSPFATAPTAPAPQPVAAPAPPPPSSAPAATARAEQPAAAATSPTIADAFSALLAMERGGGAAQSPVRLAPPLVVTDALVDQIAQRVLERLSSEKLRPIVSDIVSTIAERLVREEIERIRKQ